MNKGMKVDKRLPYKILVLLLDGPLSLIEIRRLLRKKGQISTGSIKLMQAKGWITSRKEKGKLIFLTLTQKGIVEATKWDYKLKEMNQHPKQTVIVTPIPADSESEKEMSSTAPDRNTEELLGVGAGRLRWENDTVEKVQAQPVDWEREYVILANKLADALGRKPTE